MGLVSRFLLRLALFLLPLLAGSTWAAQLVARNCGGHPALGPPWLRWGGWSLYAPWQLGPWAWRYWGQYPDVFEQPYWILLGSAVVGLVGVLLSVLWQQGRQAPSTVYGTARWATPEELQRGRLL